MIYNNVEFLFTSNEALASWGKIDSTFLSLITQFFRAKKIIQVSINSVFRNDKPGENTYHGLGQALDIQKIKYSDNQIVSFYSADENYSISDDDFLFREFKFWFGNYKFEYISAANILTGYKEQNNIYRNYSKEQKKNVLAQMGIQSLPYEINRNHLHHLHLAVNPNPSAAKIKSIKVTLAVAAGLAALSILNN